MKKVITSLLMIAIIITMTGCNNSPKETENETNTEGTVEKTSKNTVKIDRIKLNLDGTSSFKSLHFKYPKKAELGSVGTYTAISYKKSDQESDELFTILITSFENKNIEETMKGTTATYKGTKTVKDKEWTYYEDITNDTQTITHAYTYNKDTYTVTFISKVNMENLVETFMNNITFE